MSKPTKTSPAATTASDSPTEEESISETSSSSTTPSTPAESEEQTPEPAQEPQEDQQAPEEGSKDPKVSEARKYRLRAQQAEQERDELRGQIGDLQHSILARELKPQGVGIDALTAAGHAPADLFQGTELDREKLSAAVTDTATRFGIRVGVIPSQGTGDFAPRAQDPKKGKDWGQAFVEANTPYNMLL